MFKIVAYMATFSDPLLSVIKESMAFLNVKNNTDKIEDKVEEKIEDIDVSAGTGRSNIPEPCGFSKYGIIYRIKK